MEKRLTPGVFAGTVTPPSSKSAGHRLLLCAALAPGRSVVEGLSLSQDIRATLDCIRALGARAELAGNRCTVEGTPLPHTLEALPAFPCGESGSTLRFFLPVALAGVGGGRFTGARRLLERPLEPYFAIFRRQGIAFTQEPEALTVSGRLRAGTFSLPGNVSSQFFTGLLLAAPLLSGESRVLCAGPLESAEYVDMTIAAMALAGREVERLPNGVGYLVTPGPYRPFTVRVEGDWSAAAFWYAANFPDGGVKILGLDDASPQGDKVIASLAQSLARPGEARIDVSGCPDLVPALAALAALRPGEVTYIINAARLRLKESDRLATVTAVLSALGADIQETPDSLVIRGKEALAGGCVVSSHNDHRIAMMAAVAAARCREAVVLTGAEAVEKSYPGFWADYERLHEEGRP